MHAVLQAPQPAGGADRVPLRDKVALLRQPSTHRGAAAVDTVETHMSLLFLAGDTVYKLKKPVVHPPLDFGTLAARERACRDEVRLNRRLAPDVYLGVSAITRAADGRLALDGDGEPVEWLVRMRRLPAGRTLDSLIASGRIGETQVDEVAALLARFYAGAARGRLDADQYLRQLRHEHAVSRRVIGDFDGARAAMLPDAVQRFLDEQHALLRGRADAGRLVDGHGDLRPEHVWLNTPPVIIDCLEFSAPLRQVDPFDEITYLGLECARLGAPWIGPRLQHSLSAALDDRPDPRLLRFYAGYRACVRARLALAHLAEPQPREPGRWRPLALDYLRLGARFSPAPSARS
jgi:aminoglycoside phosphotransferase family enzyme